MKRTNNQPVQMKRNSTNEEEIPPSITDEEAAKRQQGKTYTASVGFY